MSLVREVQSRLSWLRWVAAGAGTIVVFNSIGFLIPVFIDADQRTELGLFYAPTVAAYLLVAGIAIRSHSNRHLQRTLR